MQPIATDGLMWSVGRIFPHAAKYRSQWPTLGFPHMLRFNYPATEAAKCHIKFSQ